MSSFDETALCVQIPVIIKAHSEGERRLVSLEASNESVDSEGDVILQSALLNSAESFIKSGHLDIDHISELGSRLGVKNPTDYIVGVPIEVKDLGGGRTGVVGELHKGGTGREKADELWSSLKAEPPVRWSASIYGFPLPGQVEDCRVSKSTSGAKATRFFVKGLDWRSLAFTRNPVNKAITGAACIVTAKSMIEIIKGRVPNGGIARTLTGVENPNFILPPRNREEMMGHFLYHMQRGNCPCSGGIIGNSIMSFAEHFMQCCGETPWDADLKALALMQLLKRERG